MLVYTPREQEPLAERRAVVGAVVVVGERGAEAVRGNGRPQLGGQRKELDECGDDQAPSVDAAGATGARSVAAVCEQQTHVERQRRAAQLKHRLAERVTVQRPALSQCMSRSVSLHVCLVYIVTWSPYKIKLVDEAEKVQKRATKIFFPSLRHMSYTQRLQIINYSYRHWCTGEPEVI